MSEASFEFVEGATSDLAFVARGPTREAVFAAAAEALLAATVEDPRAVAERDTCAVACAEPDLELLLLRFLNELIYLRDARGLLLRARRVRIGGNGELRLDAELAGEPLDPDRHALAGDVKAATAHGLRVGPTLSGPAGWEARVTLDV